MPDRIVKEHEAFMRTIKKVFSLNNKEIKLIELSPENFYKTVLIIGVVHGDEPQGKFLIENYLKIAITGKNRLFFIPCLNPDGVELKTRQNANEIDINRNFPTKNWEKIPFAGEYYGGETPASEIETKFVMRIIQEFKPDAILTLHTPFKVVNYDGPAEEIAQKISEIIDYPVKSDIGYVTPGSFGTYAGIERNIPTITLELDEKIDVKELIEPMNKIFNYLANY